MNEYLIICIPGYSLYKCFCPRDGLPPVSPGRCFCRGVPRDKQLFWGFNKIRRDATMLGLFERGADLYNEVPGAPVFKRKLRLL